MERSLDACSPVMVSVMHIHIHRGRKKTSDKKWVGTIKGTTIRGRRVTEIMTTEAPDHYSAGDKLKIRAARIYGELTNITIQWAEGPSRLQSGGESSVAAASAGLEEDALPPIRKKEDIPKEGDEVISTGGMRGVVLRVLNPGTGLYFKVRWENGHEGSVPLSQVKKV